MATGGGKQPTFQTAQAQRTVHPPCKKKNQGDGSLAPRPLRKLQGRLHFRKGGGGTLQPLFFVVVGGGLKAQVCWQRCC